MISKRVLIVALSLLAVMPAFVMGAAVNVDWFVLNQLSIDPSSYLNLDAVGSFGYTTVTPYATINGYVNSGFNGGMWDGVGINSSKAGEQATLGTVYTTLGDMSGADATGILGATTFQGHTIANGDSLIRYTYYGDSDFDGQVTDLDYGFINYAYSVVGTPDAVAGFLWGDYDRDGTVTDLDYGYINYLYSEGGAPLGNLGGSFAAASAAAVPEPSTLVLLVASCVCALFIGFRKR